MRWIRRVRHLSACERRLVLNAGFLCVAISMSMLLVRLNTLRVALHRMSRIGAPRNPYGLSPEQISWVVAAVSRFVPGSTCLTRALAVAFLLERRNCPANLRIGFIRTPDCGLTGHAWVESDGRVVMGDGDLSGCTRLRL